MKENERFSERVKLPIGIIFFAMNAQMKLLRCGMDAVQSVVANWDLAGGENKRKIN